MKLKGKISILINREETTIEIKCEKSNSTFLKVHLTPEQLSESLSRCYCVDCEFEIGHLDRIGKTHQFEKFEFELPKELKSKGTSKELKEFSQSLLTDGWISDGFFSSKDSFFTKDGKDMARTLKRRYI